MCDTLLVKRVIILINSVFVLSVKYNTSETAVEDLKGSTEIPMNY